MAALYRIGYPTPKTFALASGMESRNLRTVAEFADPNCCCYPGVSELSIAQSGRIAQEDPI
jgi:hypothetical protein